MSFKVRRLLMVGALFGIFFNAHASMVLLNEGPVVTGSDSFAFSFEVPVDTPVLAQIVDYQFPSAFDILSLAITKAGESVGQAFATPGNGASFIFDATSGEHIAHVAATIGNGSGAFGLEVRAVPLPAGLLLFGSALMALPIVARRRQKATSARVV